MGLISQAWTNLAPPGADGADCIVPPPFPGIFLTLRPQGPFESGNNPEPVDFVDNHSCHETAFMEPCFVLTASDKPIEDNQ
jgi:hypothetical protein